jgi:hypothetical protein
VTELLLDTLTVTETDALLLRVLLKLGRLLYVLKPDLVELVVPLTVADGFELLVGLLLALLLRVELLDVVTVDETVGNALSLDVGRAEIDGMEDRVADDERVREAVALLLFVARSEGEKVLEAALDLVAVEVGKLDGVGLPDLVGFDVTELLRVAEEVRVAMVVTDIEGVPVLLRVGLFEPLALNEGFEEVLGKYVAEEVNDGLDDKVAVRVL